MVERSKTSKFDYKWVVIGLCFVMVLITLGFCSSNKSLYLAPMTKALEVDRGPFSIGDSIRYITTSVINIFFGVLVAKFGTKKLICAGIICLMCSCLLYSFGDSLIYIYLAGAFLGMGFSWTGTTMVGSVVNRWCSERKGTIMGVILASNGVGAAISAQILSPIIHQHTFGYKNAYLLTVFILAILLVLMLIFYKDKKSVPLHMTEQSKGKKKKARTEWVGMGFSEARKKAYFYGTAVCIFFTGMILQGISGIAAAHMEDVGLSEQHIASVLSVSSLVLTVSKLMAGFFYDKFGLRFAVTVCNVAAVAAMIILSTLTKSTAGVILSIVYGILAAVALPLETIMLPNFALDLFGVKSFDKILGIFVSVNTAGYAVGVPLMNVSYDLWGTYKDTLLALAIIMAVIAVLLQFVITAAHKERKKELAKVK